MPRYVNDTFPKASLIVLMISISASCNLSKSNIKTSGVIQKQGITTYQYGTHTIPGYALKSNTIDLDKYIDQKVKIKGSKVDGYPVDGGPEYIEVKKIK
ncbi:MAG: hypothetical protein CL846_10055 [Crocinitomicaceae bacterium]|nr:hypothetical protein [Crocinitomicaceae bacterium]|tara:strand:+ start:411 stop:707 length:297 start_codon:yes stop_codon:yes gene_type:complete